jgi:hypothetical protein
LGQPGFDARHYDGKGNPLTGATGRSRLFIIGMMVAYDFVIENCDRFKRVISKHENMANLMFTRLTALSQGGNVLRPTAIDSQVARPQDAEEEPLVHIGRHRRPRVRGLPH